MSLAAQSLWRLGYGLVGPGFESPLLVYWVPWDMSPGVRRPKRVVDYWPSNAAVKNEWSYTFTPCVCFQGVYGVRFTITFISNVLRCGCQSLKCWETGTSAVLEPPTSGGCRVTWPYLKTFVSECVCVSSLRYKFWVSIMSYPVPSRWFINGTMTCRQQRPLQINSDGRCLQRWGFVSSLFLNAELFDEFDAP